jgi:hydrogenase maturation factor
MLIGPIAVEGTALIAREFAGELRDDFDNDFIVRSARLLNDPGISIVKQAKTLLEAGGVTAMHDPTEGGLASGIRELAGASGCGAVVNKALIPILPETEAICRHFELNPLGMLASGSLLAAVSPEYVQSIERACLDRGFRPSVIGKLTVPDRGFTLIVDGEARDLPVFAADEVAGLFATMGDSGQECA